MILGDVVYAHLFVTEPNENLRARWQIRVQYITLILVSLCVVPATLYIAARIASVFTPMAPAPSHSDLVTTVLAGLTISLAVLALMIAALAIWGYHAIKEEARKIAMQAARSAAIKHIKGDQIQVQLRDEARNVIADEFKRWTESRELSESQPAQGQSTMSAGKKVGKPLRRSKGEVKDET